MRTRVRKFAHLLERLGLAMAGAASGLFVAALVGTSVALFTSQAFLLFMMLGGAVGFYLGIDTPPLPFRASNNQPQDGGWVRVIAGEFGGAKGPARTFTPVNLLDVHLRGGHSVRLNLRDGFTGALYVLKGSIAVNSESASETELVVLDREGDEVLIEATSDARLFVMNGAPIDEPLAGHGPFVMNTPREIQQAFADLHHGRLGKIPELAR